MTAEVRAELEAIALELARMPLVDRRLPHLPVEIRSELSHRLRILARTGKPRTEADEIVRLLDIAKRK